ncbi:MAG TPA: glycosyltransferase family 4 protein [Pyrinomonadaceae bacterium]|jgi:glycosyltransferase involved in cell wall biosynthesis|nr:glycosyltransferase family 4 protein [Pyrinomonadaceae bacterium]
MKILFYNHTGQVSGAERVLLMILSQLDRECFSSVVVCPEQGPLQEMVKDLDVTVETLAGLDARFTWRLETLLRYCKSFFGVIRQLRRRVVYARPDLLHANSIRSGLVATAATIGLGTPVVWHLHDLLPHHPLSTAIRTFAAFSRRSRMIAVSEAVSRNFCGRFSRLLQDRVSVILNSIDLDKFELDETAGSAIRTELRYRKSDLAIGIVGQLTPRKGQLELLHAFSQALKKVPNSVLLIVGAPMFNRDHEYLELLKQTTAELGINKKVRLLGARSDISTIMQGLDLLVVNSAAEPFGLVILEAMACGTPVLATAVDGIPEIIRHQENGWLVPARDERALAEAIVYLHQRLLLRERLAKQAKPEVAERFSVERYLADLQKFYRLGVDRHVEVVSKQSAAMDSPNHQVEAA